MDTNFAECSRYNATLYYIPKQYYINDTPKEYAGLFFCHPAFFFQFCLQHALESTKQIAWTQPLLNAADIRQHQTAQTIAAHLCCNYINDTLMEYANLFFCPSAFLFQFCLEHALDSTKRIAWTPTVLNAADIKQHQINQSIATHLFCNPCERIIHIISMML